MDVQEFSGQLANAVLPVLQMAVLALVAWASKEIAQWISHRVKDEYARATLDRLNETVFDVVLELEQTTVQKLKRATESDSPGGSRITPEEAEDIRLEALTRVKALLGPTGVAKLLHVLGIKNEPDAALQVFLTTKIEAAVRRLKLAGGDSDGI